MSAFSTTRAEEFLAHLRRRVSERTVNHAAATAELMAQIAPQLGITEEQAVTAGLLHDSCKDMAGPELLQASDDYGIPVEATQRAKPMLLHGPVAAEECRRNLGIEDSEVYDAIYWHTTGRPHLGKVGLALYVADYSERLRSYPEAAQARALIEEHGFMDALRFVAARKLERAKKKTLIDPNTESFCAWLQGELP
jgi:predicted HD superfamily hydrolase involved in NAD metabolism